MKRATWLLEHWEKMGDRRQERGFLIAANRRVDELIGGADPYRRDRDGQIYPILFDYRHYLEVSLKRVIREYRSIDNSRIIDDRKLDRHDLAALWSEASRFMQQYYPDYPGFDRCKGVKILDEMVKWFHRVDPNSFVFRYSHSTVRQGRRRTRSSIPAINPEALKSKMREISRLLGHQSDVIQLVQQRREDERSW